MIQASLSRWVAERIRVGALLPDFLLRHWAYHLDKMHTSGPQLLLLWGGAGPELVSPLEIGLNEHWAQSSARGTWEIKTSQEDREIIPMLLTCFVLCVHSFFLVFLFLCFFVCFVLLLIAFMLWSWKKM